MVNLHLLTTYRKKPEKNQNCFKTFCRTSLLFFIQDSEIMAAIKTNSVFHQIYYLHFTTHNSSGIC